ncbi:MAG: hypothetical protein BroJett030_08090 [Alphaproteobacteria bacterium]|nr:MAG: hypothetical protein BroJett030_08090 [Alphaproteobacteria bacterium]
MFDIGWTELVVIACVAILVVGPKDLPRMLRAFGKTVSKLRRMAGDFQRQFDEALKEAELDEVKKLATGKTFQPLEDARKSMASFQKTVGDTVREIGQEVKADVTPTAEAPAAQVAKPNGAHASPPPAAPSAVATAPAADAAAGAMGNGKAKPTRAATKAASKRSSTAKTAGKASAGSKS